MKKLITIGIILIVLVSGGIYLNTLDGETIKEELEFGEIEEEKPKELEESEEEQRMWKLEERRREEIREQEQVGGEST